MIFALLACADPPPTERPPAPPPAPELVDLDGDGVPAEEECDDHATDVFPGAPETCDGRDEDCDGEADEGLIGPLYTDADGDGFGDPRTLGRGCLDGGVQQGGDCDDADPAVFPAGDARFVDGTADAGLDGLLHWDMALTPLACPNEQMVGGAAVGDVDGDGLPDVFLARVGFPDALLRNDGGTFTDIAAEAGVDAVGHHNGALLFDLEGDGDLDLFVTSLARGPHRLYVNDGAGHFVDEALARGVAMTPPEDDPCGMSFSATAGDVDGDGDLDLHVAAWQEEYNRTEGRGRFFLNDGAGFFTDATLAAGLDFSARATFSGAFVDVDGDLDQDLLSVADWHDGELYLNGGDGTFAVADAGVGTEENGMGLAVGDPDEDGDPDWFVTSVYDDTVPCPEKWGCSGNRLYLNDGFGAFADGTEAAGVRDGQWGWGAAFLDLDLDGHEDLVQVGGFPAPGFTDQTSRLWRGRGDGTFTDELCATGLVDPGQGRAVVPFDADQDGDPDVLVVGNAEVPRLWRNEQLTGNHWLAVTVPPIEAGARVRVTTAAGTQTRWVLAGAGYLASGPYEARFGLGAETVADVEVLWRDGEIASWAEVVADEVFAAQR